MILPIGFPQNQQLITLSKESGRMKPEDNIAVRFVPMVRGED
jgi:protein-L-isoaspartate O-methyltransferase